MHVCTYVCLYCRHNLATWIRHGKCKLSAHFPRHRAQAVVPQQQAHIQQAIVCVCVLLMLAIRITVDGTKYKVSSSYWHAHIDRTNTYLTPFVIYVMEHTNRLTRVREHCVDRLHSILMRVARARGTQTHEIHTHEMKKRYEMCADAYCVDTLDVCGLHSKLTLLLCLMYVCDLIWSCAHTRSGVHDFNPLVTRVT